MVAPPKKRKMIIAGVAKSLYWLDWLINSPLPLLTKRGVRLLAPNIFPPLWEKESSNFSPKSPLSTHEKRSETAFIDTTGSYSALQLCSNLASLPISRNRREDRSGRPNTLVTFMGQATNRWIDYKSWESFIPQASLGGSMVSRKTDYSKVKHTKRAT